MKEGFFEVISIEGQNLKRIRESKNIKITELAKKAKVGIATISELESGIRKKSTTPTLKKLAAALDVSINDLLGIETETEYNIVDIQEMFQIILDANDMELYGRVLNDDDKKIMATMFKATVALLSEKEEKDN
ncbi:helix-turn-helix transcriptional regulator [Clostridium botulinum]|nr:helix-turn-helix transcriptional regulator [Clostridium botulinum]NFF21837.1 helix-turn-helix transcriptional regulator [Clostridium botulinum]NFF37427.1 helix-turn-helix transcriptional regulator [Clostridium botulinum]NFI49539.1 helix-turn-helix transcriptional regulator [Clostridium botulinum]NFP19762.1 helix-turn-helix transcriptional regulator [Clostridium botulinum]